MPPEITFERVALYEEVWSTPLTTLAKKYGLSDNGVRKVCKAMSIPLPANGHWAKVAAGHKVVKPPLPVDAERTSFTSRPPSADKDKFRIAEDDAWCDERIDFERRPENRIVVESTLSRWHPAMTGLRDSLRDAVKVIPRMQREAEQLKKNPNLVRGPDFNGWRWRQFLNEGQLLHGSPMKVTPLGYERALAIFNAICVEAERRQFTVAIDEKEARLVLEGFEGRVELRISERLEEASRQEPRWDKKLENVKYKLPTGNLRLYIGATYREREMSDGKGGKLEEQLNEVFIKVWRHVVRTRVEKREREAWHRKWEADQRRHEQAEARKREAAARRTKLLDDATAWHKANAIREFLLHAEASGDKRFDAEYLIWARGVADSIDPLAER